METTSNKSPEANNKYMKKMFNIITHQGIAD